jgi:hypothetical protein
MSLDHLSADTNRVTEAGMQMGAAAARQSGDAVVQIGGVSTLVPTPKNQMESLIYENQLLTEVNRERVAIAEFMAGIEAREANINSMFRIAVNFAHKRESMVAVDQ